MPGFLLEEEVFDDHYRVVKIVQGDKVVYSIDYYSRLAGDPECDAHLETGSSPARLCYYRLTPNCEAVIVKTPGRTELVNLRLYTTTSEDPAHGSPGEARKICLERAAKLLETYGERDSAPS